MFLGLRQSRKAFQESESRPGDIDLGASPRHTKTKVRSSEKKQKEASVLLSPQPPKAPFGLSGNMEPAIR